MLKGSVTTNTSLGPVYTKHQRQYCDDARDPVLIESNGVIRKWVATPFWSNSIVFNESSIASVIAVLTLALSVNGTLWTISFTTFAWNLLNISY